MTDPKKMEPLPDPDAECPHGVSHRSDCHTCKRRDDATLRRIATDYAKEIERLWERINDMGVYGQQLRGAVEDCREVAAQDADDLTRLRTELAQERAAREEDRETIAKQAERLVDFAADQTPCPKCGEEKPIPRPPRWCHRCGADVPKPDTIARLTTPPSEGICHNCSEGHTLECDPTSCSCRCHAPPAADPCTTCPVKMRCDGDPASKCIYPPDPPTPTASDGAGGEECDHGAWISKGLNPAEWFSWLDKSGRCETCGSHPAPPPGEPTKGLPDAPPDEPPTPFAGTPASAVALAWGRDWKAYAAALLARVESEQAKVTAIIASHQNLEDILDAAREKVARLEGEVERLRRVLAIAAKDKRETIEALSVSNQQGHKERHDG